MNPAGVMSSTKKGLRTQYFIVNLIFIKREKNPHFILRLLAYRIILVSRGIF